MTRLIRALVAAVVGPLMVLSMQGIMNTTLGLTAEKCGPTYDTGFTGSAYNCIRPYWTNPTWTGVRVSDVQVEIIGDSQAVGFAELDGEIKDGVGSVDFSMNRRTNTGRTVVFTPDANISPAPEFYVRIWGVVNINNFPDHSFGLQRCFTSACP